jgi:hypothetical protein
MMKFLIALLTIASVAEARMSYTSGSGSASGYCSANQIFCINDIKLQAETQAEDFAENSCRAQRGTPVPYATNCSDFCSPPYIPPGSSTFVTCRANCNMQCELPN